MVHRLIKYVKYILKLIDKSGLRQYGTSKGQKQRIGYVLGSTTVFASTRGRAVTLLRRTGDTVDGAEKAGDSRLKKVLWVALVTFFGVGFCWRHVERRRSRPFPSWLSPLLESPAMEAVAGSSRILDGLDLVPGMRVLDVGCGPGRVTVAAARRVGPGGEVVALDVQPAMLQKLKERADASGLGNIRPVLSGIGQGALERNAFDRALLVTVLGEVPNREAALREMYAALKTGGVLSVSEVILDPHYQSRRTVRRLAGAVGFRPYRHYGNWLAFTTEFVKPTRRIGGTGGGDVEVGERP